MQLAILRRALARRHFFGAVLAFGVAFGFSTSAFALPRSCVYYCDGLAGNLCYITGSHFVCTRVCYDYACE